MLIEWIPTIGYTILASVAWFGTNHALHKKVDPKEHAFFWKLMGFLLTLLCFASLMDLQDFLHLTGKEMAISEGWYQKRRMVQIIFLFWLVSSSLGVAGYLTWIQRKMSWGYHLALITIFYLLGLQAIRAVSFHYVDKVLELQWQGMLVNNLMEYAGLGAMLLAILFSGRENFWKRYIRKAKNKMKLQNQRQSRHDNVKPTKSKKSDPMEETRQRLARRTAFREKQARLLDQSETPHPPEE